MAESITNFKMWRFLSLPWFQRQVVSEKQTILPAQLFQKPKACFLFALTANCTALVFLIFFLVMVCKFAFFFFFVFNLLLSSKGLRCLAMSGCSKGAASSLSLTPLSLRWTRLPRPWGASQARGVPAGPSRSLGRLSRPSPWFLLCFSYIPFSSHMKKEKKKKKACSECLWFQIGGGGDSKLQMMEKEISCETKCPVLITWSEIVFMSRAPCASSIFVLTLIVTLFVYCVLWKLVIGWESLWASILIN